MTGGCRPYQNRVSPWGTAEVVRAFASKAWLACKLEVDRTRKVQRNDNRAFNGRRRVLFSPSRYTELFFLDEATALAAGHRPCSCCRRAAFDAFMVEWARSHPSEERWSAARVDTALHTQRIDGGGHKRRHAISGDVKHLPDGAMLELVREGEEESSAWLVWRGSLLRWSHQGYCERISKELPLPGGSLLTPPGTIAVLSSGAIVPRVDPSADLLSAQPPGSSV
ncbi:hypothetical protein EMIHUDRAFT_194234 [Emiliania huxleyi CCMP1516]|uniref:Uncharacterized protein n=2 Tax=Emiliania huxleyi TaxID=2903 RepID=A0A0D3L159_EMIH1|nr:hypothetical protein EMIHUDRAFT_194234 [Emiliania huxleyi CCMP1516]EOD41744.1 hypothetical protein EMIHUDRAFT_194234 [Emiliania huxleyi CCMP1516]|eukprot:XP_005794173.1 hypothetical protein EMIHUDRAFT_194234 [Emiliania huxleyi CCMP1516]